MQHVRIRMTANGHEDEVHPVYDLLVNGDDVERATALQWSYTGEALGMLHYVEGDPLAFEAAIERIEAVIGFELVHAGERASYAYVRGETTPAIDAMWGPVTAGGLLIVPPIHFHADGTVTMSMFGPEGAHRRAFTNVPDPVDVTVEAVGDLGSMVGPETRLSDRQREALETGLELGYYETPREANQADVAAAMDCAPSTAAEHLQKAEVTLARSALGR